ncbi:MAG: SAM-dependent methyltransferase [Thermoprotei archaeon]|nr:MAG: SAM-dependent methyltransferase [Thermoprotei archaeon]RLF20390.1 MAG: SAM-dependent methyltransferase [Thermoprotei archaeon]
MLRAPIVHYSPAPKDVVRVALDMLRLHKGELLFDLGCGDGRILIMAAKYYNVKAVGIEIRRGLARIAKENAKRAGVADLVEVIRGDFFRIDLSKADAITLYLSSKVNEALKMKFINELRDGTRIVSIFFPIPSWNPIEVRKVRTPIKDFNVYLYEMNPEIRR